MIYRTAPFSMILNDPYPQFQGTPFFNAEYIINGMTYRHSFNEILIETYTRPTQQCYLEWPWVTLSDLAKYSVTRSVARSLCDSWASCYGRPLSVSGRPCYILPMFFIYLFIYFFNGRLILRPCWTEVRESFTRGGPWVSLKKLLLGFFPGHP